MTHCFLVGAGSSHTHGSLMKRCSSGDPLQDSSEWQKTEGTAGLFRFIFPRFSFRRGMRWMDLDKGKWQIPDSLAGEPHIEACPLKGAGFLLH